MARSCRLGRTLLSLGCTWLLLGCGNPDARRSVREDDTATVAARASSDAGGGLLKTGAFQLGSGVGKDLLWFQGDGEGGFFTVD